MKQVYTQRLFLHTVTLLRHNTDTTVTVAAPGSKENEATQTIHI